MNVHFPVQIHLLVVVNDNEFALTLDFFKNILQRTLLQGNGEFCTLRIRGTRQNTADSEKK